MPLFSVAEVMDKEPAILVVWVSAFLLAVLGVAAAALRWWAGLIFTAVAVMLSIAILLEIHDPYVCPAIRREAGSGYVVQVYAAAATAIVSPLLAAILSKRHSMTTVK